jgi:hypothetical protein
LDLAGAAGCRFGEPLTSKKKVNMADPGGSWAKQGPASYFPSIEKKYGRTIAAGSGSSPIVVSRGTWR